MVTQRKKHAKDLTASVAAYKGKIASRLAKRLSPGLRGETETMPDHALTLDLVSRSVEAARDELVHVHERYVRQTALCNRLSERCNRLAAKEVYPRAVGLPVSWPAYSPGELGIAVSKLSHLRGW